MRFGFVPSTIAYLVQRYLNFRIDEHDIAAELKKKPWRESCGKR